MGGGWLIFDHRLLKNIATEGTERNEGGEPIKDGRLKTAGRFAYQSWNAGKRREAPTFSMAFRLLFGLLGAPGSLGFEQSLESIRGINILSA